MQEIMEIISGILTDAVSDFQVHINAAESAESRNKEESLRILRRNLKEAESKEMSLWDKYADDAMPKHIFDKLLEKVSAQKAEIVNKITDIEAEPEPIDFESKIVTFSQAIQAINNPESPAKETNDLLKSCIRRITYSRERGHRESGSKRKGGWIINPIQLEIELNL
jgi:hypothetical protein